MRVDDELLKSVVFIGHTEYVAEPGKADIERYDGTGFFVTVPSRRPGVFPFVYLVTAKHVIAKTAPNFWVRENLKAGGIHHELGGSSWFTHPSDDTADVAVFPWALDDESDHIPIPLSQFVSPEKWRLREMGIGDEVFLLGVFPSVSGMDRNTPIVRKGNLALLPEGKIRVTRDKRVEHIDAYLIEAHSFGGISGSPVFVREAAQTKFRVAMDDDKLEDVITRGAGDHHLLGLVWGHYEIDDDDLSAMYPRPPRGEERGLNLGIGIVVPASKIEETLLTHRQLVEQRTRVEEELDRNSALTVQDSTEKPPTPPPPVR